MGPVYHPGRASPLPYLRGKAYGLARSAQPGPQLSPPSQLPTPESQAELSGGLLETLERVTVRGRGIHGQEPTYCVLSLLFSQSLSHYFAHPSPILTYLFIFYTLTHWPRSSHFSTCSCRQTRSSSFLSFVSTAVFTAPLTAVYMLSSARSTMTITIYIEQTAITTSMTPNVHHHCPAALNTLHLY